MKVALVILNWNGKHWLEKFLPSLIELSPGAEVVVADNNSSDDSVAFLNENFPEVSQVHNTENYGYAGGYNEALKQVEAELFVLVNSDIEVSPNWLEPLVKAFENNPKLGAAQPKIRSQQNKAFFEYAGASGGYIDRWGYPFCRGRMFDHLEKDSGQYNQQQEIFWATGACMAVRAEAFWKAGGLDADFFAHMEEIDLCWRLKHLHYSIQVIPESMVYHVGGGTLDALNPKKTYLNFRNGLFLIYKNLPSSILWPTLLGRMILDGIAALKFIFEGKFKHFSAVFKAHMHFYKAIGSLKKKRKAIASPLNFKTDATVYPKSIVRAFFLAGKKRFSELDWN